MLLLVGVRERVRERRGDRERERARDGGERLEREEERESAIHRKREDARECLAQQEGGERETESKEIETLLWFPPRSSPVVPTKGGRLVVCILGISIGSFLVGVRG